MGTGTLGPGSDDCKAGLSSDFNLPWLQAALTPAQGPWSSPFSLPGLGHRISELQGRETKKALGLSVLTSSTKQMGRLRPRQDPDLPFCPSLPRKHEPRCGWNPSLPILSGRPWVEAERWWRL